MVFVEILKYICAFFDWIIYSIAELCYVLFAAMCEMNLAAIGESFTGLVERVKVFIGIIMLFVVAFNLLKILVEPSGMEKGTSEMIKKIAISIVLLVSSSFIFTTLDEFQTAIIKENVLENVILGTTGKSQNDGLEKYVATGKFFSYNLFFSFLNIDDSLKRDIMGVDESGNALSNGPTAKLFDAVKAVNNEGVTYEYPIISGAAGILLAVMLVIFAIDVGVRAFTLVLLQVISPIPIILYITPSGTSMLSKFLKAYISTYIELFSKIAIAYITLYLMQFTMKAILGMGTSDLFPNLNGASGIFRVLLLIVVFVALFMFAKKFPKMLSDILGMNFGSTSFNPFKVAGGVLKTGARLGLAAGGLAVGATIGGVAAAKTGAGVGGVFKSMAKGAASGAQTGYKVKDVRSALSAATTGTRDNFRSQRAYAQGLGAQGGAAGVRAQKSNEKNERAIREAEARMNVINQGDEIVKNMETAAETNAFKNNYNSNRTYTDASGATQTRNVDFSNYSSRDEYVEGKTAFERSQLDRAMQSGVRADIESATASYNEAKRLATEDVEFAKKDTVANTADNPNSGNLYNEYVKYQTHVAANSELYSGNKVSSASDISTATAAGKATKTAEQQKINTAQSNETAVKAAQAQAKGAATAARQGENKK